MKPRPKHRPKHSAETRAKMSAWHKKHRPPMSGEERRKGRGGRNTLLRRDAVIGLDIDEVLS
jgi:hypothetical protein